MILATVLSIEKGHPSIQHIEFLTIPFLRTSSLQQEPSASSEEVWPPLLPHGTIPAVQPHTTRRTPPTGTNRPARSHESNQPMKESVIEEPKAKVLRFGNSELLGILLFLATWWCHLTAHVPTVGILGFLLSGLKDLERA